MKTEKIIGLRHCPVCGSPAVMRKNASKRFQVHCRKCEFCTAWTSKPDAIIRWYNNSAIYENLNGVTPPITGEAPEDRLADAKQALDEAVEKFRTGGTINATELEKIATQLIKLAKE